MKILVVKQKIVEEKVLKEFKQGTNLDDVIKQLKELQKEFGKDIIISIKEEE